MGAKQQLRAGKKRPASGDFDARADILRPNWQCDRPNFFLNGHWGASSHQDDWLGSLSGCNDRPKCLA